MYNTEIMTHTRWGKSIIVDTDADMGEKDVVDYEMEDEEMEEACFSQASTPSGNECNLSKCSSSYNQSTLDGMLLSAVKKNSLEEAAWWIKSGADVNARVDCQMSTPLFYVESCEMAKLLVESGASLGCTNKVNSTVLSEQRNYNVIKYFLEQRMDVNHQNKNGWTVLHKNMFQYNLDNVKLILDHGANTNLFSSSGYTPLYFAKTTEAIQLLMNYGALAFVRNPNGETPEMFFNMYRHNSSTLVQFIKNYTGGISDVLVKGIK